MILLFSITAIQAGEVNITDLSMQNSSDDAIQIEDSSEFSDSDVISSDNLSVGQITASLNENGKNKTELASPSTNIYYNGPYNVTLKDSSTNCSLAKKRVYFTINNVNYNSTTDKNGVASVNLKLTPGKYRTSIHFDGDKAYEASTLTSSFKVLPTIKASDQSKYYKGSTKYKATFLTSQGKALANRNVNVKINGKSYTKKTNKNGFVSLPVNLKPGTYKIVSTDPVTGYKLTTTFKVLSTISASNLNKVQGDSRKFSIKFYKSNGKALVKKYVKLKLNGKTHNVKTNSKGIATLSLKKLKKGTYKVVCYNKDGLSKKYTIKVFKRKASTKLTTKEYTFLPKDTKELRIKLSTSLNDDSNSGRTVKITVDGKTYSKKTDGNGIINFKLPSLKKGVYKVNYKYEGNKFFKASKSSNYITLLNDTSVTKLKVKGTKSFGYGAGTLLRVAYTADGVPLAKRTVNFNIGGENYTNTTDYKGIAAVPINLKIGNHTIYYQTDDDSIVNGTSGSFKIQVFKRSPSKVTWKCGTSYKDNLQTFKVLVTDSNGKAISGGTVELIIDGETYNGTIGSNGYATVKTEVALGKYKVSVKFLGNNEYLPSSKISKSVNVKLSKYGSGLNQKNAKSLRAYLKSSWHCKVGSPAIKKLVKSLTKGLTNDIDKAKALFNYVRDTLDYSYYYNSKYGAAKTLKLKKGNCVDHSHLLVAMYRTAGFQARYVHGVCHFIKSGDTTGHVWTQVKIGKTWVCGDPISYSNSLGKIKNWDTKNYYIHAKYASLPF